MASGWDPLRVLPAMQLRAMRGGPRVKEIQMGSHQLVPKPSQEFALAAAKQLPSGFYSSFDESVCVK